jgi:hypothetical protein
MKRSILLCFLLVAVCLSQQQDLRLVNANGVRLTVDKENDMAALRIYLPDESDSGPGIFVLFPEHVTAREHGKEDATHLYLFRVGRQSSHPEWHRIGQSLEYEAQLAQGISMKARATLENDGIRYSYQFTNHSSVDYDMMQAVTDPRMLSAYFKDVRLERTYVHHKTGFELLAAETAERISMPLNRWLPNRYRASYTWPVEAQRTTKGDDGITFYNKSRAVDEPFIATKSTDGQWVMATFSYDPGNVWSNPELTCQHADPQIALHPGQTRGYELKTLVMRGTLEQVLADVRMQRASLRH